ncbi:hypothetical protein Pmani_000191 [Petrolisthes manimaculis]|uniref:Uncharacterized protein n=1 Tax=Petrolisthes manimaculis TaxID=1843537 RepID=A0AAE1ULI0_9EUCA|nr:hypothetical protein Pmani_000191 [Petrolisthes manimaculis]
MKVPLILMLCIGIFLLFLAQEGDCQNHILRMHSYRQRPHGNGPAPKPKNCVPREERGKYRAMATLTQCNTPKKTLVTLDTPHDFKWIHPTAVHVNRCDGHQCSDVGEHCVPTISTQEVFYVEGEMKNGAGKQCANITARVDMGCECGCVTQPSDCGRNWEYNEMMCQCQCLTDLEEKCRKKMSERPGVVMWDGTTCTCPCNNEVECSTGTSWVPEYCSCRSVSHVDP